MAGPATPTPSIVEDQGEARLLWRWEVAVHERARTAGSGSAAERLFLADRELSRR